MSASRSYRARVSTVTRPRGPLPPRVYWTRRVLVLVVALGLVFGIAHLLGSGGGGGTSAPAARRVGAVASATPTAPTSPAAPTGPAQTATTRANASPSPTPLASPNGPCASSDIVATPSVRGTAYAGKPVVFGMKLTTKVSPACNFDVTAESLAVRITSGSDRVWSTQDCVGAVPRESVVVRKDQPVSVTVVWNGQRSDAECTRTTPWAEPGYYHVVAASFGAEPIDVQFELRSPVPRTITATPTPKNQATTSPSGTPSVTASGSPSASPTKKSR